MKRLMVAVAVLFTAVDAAAKCATEAEVAAFVADYLSNKPAVALAKGGTMEDALCTQAKLTRALTPHMGPVIGYKVGLTSRPAQERFEVNGARDVQVRLRFQALKEIFKLTGVRRNTR